MYSDHPDFSYGLRQKGAADSHEVVGKSVAYCLTTKKDLPELTLAEWQGLSTMTGEDIYDSNTLEASINDRIATGGTLLKWIPCEIDYIKAAGKQK